MWSLRFWGAPSAVQRHECSLTRKALLALMRGCELPRDVDTLAKRRIGRQRRRQGRGGRKRAYTYQLGKMIIKDKKKKNRRQGHTKGKKSPSPSPLRVTREFGKWRSDQCGGLGFALTSISWQSPDEKAGSGAPMEQAFFQGPRPSCSPPPPGRNETGPVPACLRVSILRQSMNKMMRPGLASEAGKLAQVGDVNSVQSNFASDARFALSIQPSVC